MDFSQSNEATFKFNFFGSNEAPKNESSDTNITDESRIREYEANGTASIVQVPPSIIEQQFSSTPLGIGELKCLKTESNKKVKTDIIPGKYEGGNVLWFGALDLVNYLDAQQFSFENKSVIELGCGHGLPGIYTLTRNANVVFQVCLVFPFHS